MKSYSCIFFLVLLTTATGCFWGDSAYDQIDIAGDYEVYAESKDKYVFQCNPGCEGINVKGNIIHAKWNNRAILLKSRNKGSIDTYIIATNKDKLKCCYNDALIGPLNNLELKEVLTKYQIDTTEFTNEFSQ